MPLPKNNPRRIPRAMELEPEPMGNATWSEFNLDPINAVIAIASNINTWGHQTSLTNRWLRETSLNVGDLQNFPTAMNTAMYGLGLRWFPNAGLTRDTRGDIFLMGGYRLDLLTQQILNDIGQTQHTFPANTTVWVYASGTYLDRVEQTGGQGTPFPFATPASVDLYFDDVGAGNPPNPPAGYGVVGGVDTDGVNITNFYSPDEIPAPYTWGKGIVAQVQWLFTKNVEFQDSIIGTLFEVDAEAQFNSVTNFFDSVVFNVDTTFIGPATHIAPVTIISGPTALTVSSSDNGSKAIAATGEAFGITTKTLSDNAGVGIFAETTAGAFSNSYAVRGVASSSGHGGRFDSDDGHGITIMTSAANKASLNIGTQATKPSSPEVGDLSVRPTGEYDLYDGTDHRQVWATPSGMLAAYVRDAALNTVNGGVLETVMSKTINLPAGQSALVIATLKYSCTGDVNIYLSADNNSIVSDNVPMGQDKLFVATAWIPGPVTDVSIKVHPAVSSLTPQERQITVLGAVKSTDVL